MALAPQPAGHPGKHGIVASSAGTEARRVREVLRDYGRVRACPRGLEQAAVPMRALCASRCDRLVDRCFSSPARRDWIAKAGKRHHSPTQWGGSDIGASSERRAGAWCATAQLVLFAQRFMPGRLGGADVLPAAC